MKKILVILTFLGLMGSGVILADQGQEAPNLELTPVTFKVPWMLSEISKIKISCPKNWHIEKDKQVKNELYERSGKFTPLQKFGFNQTCFIVMFSKEPDTNYLGSQNENRQGGNPVIQLAVVRWLSRSKQPAISALDDLKNLVKRETEQGIQKKIVEPPATFRVADIEGAKYIYDIGNYRFAEYMFRDKLFNSYKFLIAFDIEDFALNQPLFEKVLSTIEAK